MRHIDTYSSPIGMLGLVSDGNRLCELCFEREEGFWKRFGQSDKLQESGAEKPAAAQALGRIDSKPCPALNAARAWLDVYFKGKDPGPLPPLALSGTAFEMEVWDLVSKIPYGKVVTYGSIADALCAKHGGRRQSARAVGGAVGRNPIPIIVPCHRVIGANGKLTGFSAGLDLKIALLHLEGIDSFRA